MVGRDEKEMTILLITVVHKCGHTSRLPSPLSAIASQALCNDCRKVIGFCEDCALLEPTFAFTDLIHKPQFLGTCKERGEHNTHQFACESFLPKKPGRTGEG